MTILDNLTCNPHPSVATIGFFDGVHLGHRHLIQQVKREAETRGLSSLAITFADHPLTVIRPGWTPQLLTTREEKTTLLAQTGIDSIALMHFDKAMQMMSAQEFMRNILKNIYNVRVLIIGYDHHFGHDRSKGFADYQQYGTELGIEVLQSERFSTDITPSSTLARTSLLSGDVATANNVLGYPFFIEGTVVEGFQNGRKLGYPTANLSVSHDKLIPSNGVYLVKAGNHYGMLNIGTRPTLDNGNQRSIEVHIFDFEGNLYNKLLRIELLRFIREERKFHDITQLQTQLENDEHLCRAIVLK